MDKRDVLEKMMKERDNLNNQIEKVKNLEIKPVTQDEWLKLCETPIRYSNIILELAKETFPNGVNFKRTPNEVKFELYGFEVLIPTHQSKVVKIDTHWYSKYYNKEIEVISSYKYMRKYFELLDSGTYNWYDLAYCRCAQRDEFSKFKLFMWWFIGGKWRKVNRVAWNDLFKKEENHYKNMIENRHNLKKHVEENMPKFIKAVEELSGFGKVYGYVDINGVYGLNELDEFVNKIRGEINENMS